MYEMILVRLLLAALLALGVGYIWYHPKLFGKQWMRMNHITPESVEKGKKRMPFIMLLAFCANALVAWALHSLVILFGIHDLVGMFVSLVLFVWLGFCAPLLLGTFLWEQKPFKLFAINAGYWFVTLCAMSLVLLA
jgi:Protein of unknown function (DUF1761)